MFRPHAPTTELNIVSTTQMKNDIIVEIIRERRGVPVDKESTWGHPHPAWSKDNIKLILCTPVEHSVVTTDSWRNHQPFASSSHPYFPPSLVSLPPFPIHYLTLYCNLSYFHFPTPLLSLIIHVLILFFVWVMLTMSSSLAEEGPWGWSALSICCLFCFG